MALALPAEDGFGCEKCFCNLFLSEESCAVLELDVAVGKLSKVSESIAEFRELAVQPDSQEEWFAEKGELAAATQGLLPNASQCIGFSTPLVFAEGGAGNSHTSSTSANMSRS